MDIDLEKGATLRSWLSLALLTMPVLLLSIDLTVLAVAVPALSADIDPSASQLLWIMDIYGIFLAGLLILMGTLGDRIGRKRLLIIGAILFGIASTLAANASTPMFLILSRALLGVGGATLMPSTLSLIRNIFTNQSERRIAISVWAAAFAGGAGLGPIIGGFLLEHFEWGSVFLINVPIMIVLVCIAPMMLPESKDPNPGRFDAFSAILLILSMLTLVYGLKHAAEYGWKLGAIGIIFAGGILGAVFAFRQHKLKSPLVDISLFKSVKFSIAVVANIAGIFALVTVLYFYPQYTQVVLGKTPLVSGVWALPIAGGAIIGAILAPIVSKRIPTSWIMGSGLIIAGIGYLTMTFLTVEESMPIAFIGGSLIGIGVGLANTLTNDIIIDSAPPNRSAAAAGISETAYELGGSMGIAILGSIGTSTYRNELGSSLGNNFPNDVIDLAKKTVSAGHIVSQHIPDYARQSFLMAVDESFTSAMGDAFMIGAIILVIVGILSMTLLHLLRDRN